MWPKCVYRGIEYTFDHLAPFTLVVNGKRVRVQFGAHVFCQDVKPGDPWDMRFHDGRTPRTFCPVRHGMSLTLGQRILAASNGEVFESGRNLIFKDALPHPQGWYVIAFSLRRSNSPKYDVKMQLFSAHSRPQVSRSRKTDFSDAVTAIHLGQNIPWKKK